MKTPFFRVATEETGIFLFGGSMATDLQVLRSVSVGAAGDASFSVVNLCSKVDILKLFLQFLLLYCMIKEKADPDRSAKTDNICLIYRKPFLFS
jgi:hypothetical protein